MIRYKTGNLLATNTEALVNTINTVGVMGKGIALQFKETYPENYRVYCDACKAGTFKTGEVLVVRDEYLGEPKWIINFPTKVPLPQHISAAILYDTCGEENLNK